MELGEYHNEIDVRKISIAIEWNRKNIRLVEGEGLFPVCYSNLDV